MNIFSALAGLASAAGVGKPLRDGATGDMPPDSFRALLERFTAEDRLEPGQPEGPETPPDAGGEALLVRAMAALANPDLSDMELAAEIAPLVAAIAALQGNVGPVMAEFGAAPFDLDMMDAPDGETPGGARLGALVTALRAMVDAVPDAAGNVRAPDQAAPVQAVAQTQARNSVPAQTQAVTQGQASAEAQARRQAATQGQASAEAQARTQAATQGQTPAEAQARTHAPDRTSVQMTGQPGAATASPSVQGLAETAGRSIRHVVEVSTAGAASTAPQVRSAAPEASGGGQGTPQSGARAELAQVLAALSGQQAGQRSGHNMGQGAGNGSGQNAGQFASQFAGQPFGSPAALAPTQGAGSLSGQFSDLSGETARAGQGEPLLQVDKRSVQQAGIEPRAASNTAQQAAPAGPGSSIGGAPQVQPAMPSPAAPPQVPQMPDSRQILGQVRAHVTDSGTIRVALRPEGLGRVEISLVPRQDGQLSVTLRADQPSVLSSLRADREGLVALLRDAGHQVDARAVSFSDLDRSGTGDGLRQAPGQGLRDGAGQQAAQHSAGGQSQTPNGQSDHAATGDAAADPHDSKSRAPGISGAVDITV